MPPRSLSDRSPVSVLETNWDNHLGGESSNEEEEVVLGRGSSSYIIKEKHRSNKLNQSSSKGTNGVASGGRRVDRDSRDCLPNNTHSNMITRKKSNLSTTSSRSNGKNGKTKRSIVFAPKNSFHDVPHLDDMTPDEIATIWYDPKEYSEIKASYQLTIVRMEAALESNVNDEKFSFIENDEQTFRGLEYRTQTGAWARYENKRDAYNAVLDEQDRQWKNDKDDYDSLSRVYMEHSAKCAQAAYQRGVEDASIARTVCASLYNRKPKKSSSSRTRSTSPTARTNRTPRSGTKSGSSSGGSRSDSEDSTDTNKSSDLRNNTNNVKKLLREQSFSRRNQIRDDISNIQQQKNTTTSTKSSRTRSTSPKKDRSLSPKARSTSPKASRSSSKSAAVIAV